MSSQELKQFDGPTTSKQELWKRQYELIAALLSNVLVFVKALVFADSEDIAVVCIDERVQRQSGPITKMRFWRLPGSGILLGDSWEESLRKAEAMLCGKVKIISWHKDCGAAALAKNRFGLDGTADEIAERFAEELAKRLGVACLQIENHGPVGFHSARGVVYDGTGAYQPSDQMPDMFVVSRKLTDDRAIALQNLVMANSIAMGGHGFGEKFNDQPFAILVLAETGDQLAELLEEVGSQKSYLEGNCDTVGAALS